MVLPSKVFSGGQTSKKRPYLARGPISRVIPMVAERRKRKTAEAGKVTRDVLFSTSDLDIMPPQPELGFRGV
jgi:hypothetical protein